MKTGRKNFFFEKKKQKTFVNFPPGDVATSRVKANKSFLRSWRPDDRAERGLNRAAQDGLKKRPLSFIDFFPRLPRA
jgi:hypothetical protein